MAGLEQRKLSKKEVAVLNMLHDKRRGKTGSGNRRA